ncbi:MAG: RluA family pseudouridine synthase [Flavobacteriales bacterium]|jgi:tRNA pseudouridine32 synthase/23S rRNA pseudouridine746 synthase|nr:RluA family pseudouridine synthase [Flavobacteriales bacterium]
MTQKQSIFTVFEDLAKEIDLPKKFTFPFYYQPHPLAISASKILQNRLINDSILSEYFEKNEEAVGKMFGVLVVKNKNHQLGFISAFSGKLMDSMHYPGFTPPLFDVHHHDGFYKKEESKQNQLTAEIHKLENDSTYLLLEQEFQNISREQNDALEKIKKDLQNKRIIRRAIRKKVKETGSPQEIEEITKKHAIESLKAKQFLQKEQKKWEEKTAPTRTILTAKKEQISLLKTTRKKKSQELQNWIFENYIFHNARQESNSLKDIFIRQRGIVPPAGTGECAAPKLLEFAYKNDYQPLALAEFWWGPSPPSQIRKQGNFYPSCRSKCEPILGFMLQGLEINENPMLQNPAEGKKFETIFEDEDLLVINKPAEFLSVPGKNISDSVETRLKQKYLNYSGPFLVHRLDMSTSGLLLAAKNKKAHEILQKQFLKKTINKEYIALLDGEIQKQNGFIDLPLRVDLDNRPYQLVCHKHGKNARTQYEVLETKNGKTKVKLFPITGRTHQLRVHCAHKNGLNTPIIGDDLYGTKRERLCLHAQSISFDHPVTGEKMSFSVKAEF